MVLPNRCSFFTKKHRCKIPPSFILSIIEVEEYLVGMSCHEHVKKLQEKIIMMQKKNQVPKGRINIQKTIMVSTNCIKGNKDDYEDVLFRRSTDM